MFFKSNNKLRIGGKKYYTKFCKACIIHTYYNDDKYKLF